MVATVREKSGKNKTFSRSGKVRELFKKSGKIFGIVKVSERLGDSVFRFIVHISSCNIYNRRIHKSFSRFWNAFGKDKKYAAKKGRRSIWHSMPDTFSNCGQWFLLWNSFFHIPSFSFHETQKEFENEEINIDGCKQS